MFEDLFAIEDAHVANEKRVGGLACANGATEENQQRVDAQESHGDGEPPRLACTLILRRKVVSWIAIWASESFREQENCTLYVPAADTVCAAGPDADRSRRALNASEAKMEV